MKTAAFLGEWLLHYDASAHSSNIVQQFLAKHKITELRQPPYSPDDVTSCVFWLFPKLKIPLKEHRFDDTETIKKMRRVH